MLPSHQPDKEEKIIRFVCGGIAGAVLNTIAWFHSGFGVEIFLLTASLAVLACGMAAVYYGDRFWHGLLGIFRCW